MEPNKDQNNSPQTTGPTPPTPPTQPASPATDTPQVQTAGPTPPVPPTQVGSPTPAIIKPNSLNYAGFIFFTLLIIGFTFNLAFYMKLPLIIIILISGYVMYKDYFKDKQIVSLTQTTNNHAAVVTKKQHSMLFRVMRVVLIIFGILGILFVGLILLLVIALQNAHFG